MGRHRPDVLKEALRIAARAPAGADTAEAIVAAARDPRSPMHDAFPWDDAEAAHKHRLVIAREILRESHELVVHRRRSIEVVTLIPNPRIARNYLLTSSVARSKGLKHEAMIREIAQIYGDLERLLGLAVRFEYGDQVTDRIEQMEVLLGEIEKKI